MHVLGKERSVLVAMKKAISVETKCPARDRACRMCGVIGYFRVKCPRARQRGGGGSESRVDKCSNRGRRNTESTRGDGRGRRGRGPGCGKSQETNLVADGSHSG